METVESASALPLTYGWLSSAGDGGLTAATVGWPGGSLTCR